VIVLTFNKHDFDAINRHCKNLIVDEYPPNQ
jgi:hypothetical protein